jgi:regulator of CtrA degradation
MVKPVDTIGSIFQNGQLDQRILEAAYQEAMSITIDIAAYLEKDKIQVAKLTDRRLVIIHATESLRMSSCLMQSVAWFMIQMGVNKGEMTKEEAGQEKYRLGGRNICLATSHKDLQKLSEEFKELSHRSIEFYKRIDLIDQMFNEEEKTNKNPVHAMMLKIKENNFGD